jgi:hypothetical protein
MRYESVTALRQRPHEKRQVGHLASQGGLPKLSQAA